MIGVAQRVVERAQRLLAAVEVDDRHALERRGERRRRGLEPVADEQQRVGPARRGGRRRRAAGRRRPAGGWTSARRVGRPSSQRELGGGLEPVRAHRLDRGAVARREVHAPGDERPGRRSRLVADRDAGRAEDAPVLAAGGQDRDRPRGLGSRSSAGSPRSSGSTSRARLDRARPVRRPTSVAGPRRARARSRVAARRVVGGHDVPRPAGSVASGGCAGRRARSSRSASTGAFTPVPMRRPRRPGSPHHRLERRRFERGRVVGARPRPIEGQVLLDQRGPGRDRGDRDVDARRVVRPADRHAERAAHASRSPGGSRRPGRAG